MNTINENVYLRLATKDDIDLLFLWANDTQVRNNAFHIEKIPYEDHKKWFSKVMRDDLCIQYIFVFENKPIGQIRFSILNDEAEIDYSIVSNMRGKGYGKLMLNLAREELHKSYPSIKTLIGRVKNGNYASEKSFAECGYEKVFTQFEFRY